MKSEIFNIDCMIGMKEFPDNHFDLAVVDPWYQNNDAVNLVNGGTNVANRTSMRINNNIAPDDSYFIELKRVSKNTIVWGGSYFGLKGGVIAWNKYGTAFGEGEVAICSTHNSVRFFNYVWNGMIQHDMKNKEQRIHPTQKPVKLYEWIFKNYAQGGQKILDTHLGSGSSRIAAYNYGMDFTGYEIDKDYFEAAEKRFQNHIAQLKIFA